MSVVGTGFADGCLPVDGDAPDAGDAPPIEGIRLVVTQGSTTISVAQVNADADGFGFETRFGLPASLGAGPAQVRAQTSLEADAQLLATAEFAIADS